jgi:hypothetical protein
MYTKNFLRYRGWAKHIFSITMAIAAAIALAGCASEQPVYGSSTAPSSSPLPSSTPTAVDATPAPTPTATPLPSAPAPYSFPMSAAGLFSPSTPPDDYSSPVYISDDSLMFLYKTQTNSIMQAQWNGTSYSSLPIAENITADATINTYVDSAKKKLFCQGVKLYSDGQTRPAIVMVSLEDGTRCNMDEYINWKVKDSILSGQFQYADGNILSQVEENRDDQVVAVNKWAIINVAAKTYKVLDMSTFASLHLQDWETLLSLKLVLTKDDRLMAICFVRSPSVKEITPVTTKSYTFGCFTYLLDMNGEIIKDRTAVVSSESPENLALSSAELFNLSPDGKYLLFSNTKPSSGLFLYDLAQNKEYTIQAVGNLNRVFAQWGTDDSIYYGTSAQPDNENIIVQKTRVSLVLNPE